MSTPHITKSPHVCGGEACIAGRGIPVWVLVGYRKLGTSDDQLLNFYLGLSMADLQAAWEYAAAHTQEIDRALREYLADEAG
jgi:uncharacterized protein (DUF433 family)